MTPREIILYKELKEKEEVLQKWTVLVYLLVSKFGNHLLGENGELLAVNIDLQNVSKVKLPTLEYPLNWNYDREKDSLSVSIAEEKEKLILLT